MSKNLRFIKRRLDGVLAQMPYLPRSVALVWKASRRLTLVWAILLLAQGLLPVATVYLTRFLVNALVAAVNSGSAWQDIRPAFLMAALLVAILLLAAVLRSVGSWMRAAQSERVQDHITRLIHEKSVAADLAFYETPDFYDHLHRARAEAGSRPIAMLESLGNLFQSSVTLNGRYAESWLRQSEAPICAS
jgi:ATP-binding cassette subfamily B protein